MLLCLDILGFQFQEFWDFKNVACSTSRQHVPRYFLRQEFTSIFSPLVFPVQEASIQDIYYKLQSTILRWKTKLAALNQWKEGIELHKIGQREFKATTQGAFVVDGSDKKKMAFAQITLVGRRSPNITPKSAFHLENCQIEARVLNGQKKHVTSYFPDRSSQRRQSKKKTNKFFQSLDTQPFEFTFKAPFINRFFLSSAMQKLQQNIFYCSYPTYYNNLGGQQKPRDVVVTRGICYWLSPIIIFYNYLFIPHLYSYKYNSVNQ